ncbi:MAG TPA: ABC transporter substrate-binding protein [Candidatus Limnocylindria bacterium]|nr:ABC transporter substrate-binding protein [Candidatus Limnocylindria bacterium]
MFALRAATTLVILILVSTGCAQPASPTAPQASGSRLREVRLLLGFRPDVQFAAFYLAQRGGYFAEAGLEVTIEHSNDVIRLVADGQAEFGVADATDLMIARTAGIPIKYVSTLYSRFPVALIGAPDVVPGEPAGLVGLRIGTPGRFGSSWHALLALLDAGGLTEDDVAIREYPAFNQVEGLLNGDVDMITGFRVNEPLQLEARGFEVALLTVDEIVPLPGPGVVVGDGLLAADRDLVADFAGALARAQRAIADDVDVGLAAAIAEVPVIGENRETARAVLRATVELWKDERGRVSPDVDQELWRVGYHTMRDLGFIDGSVPLDQMYADPFVQRL